MTPLVLDLVTRLKRDPIPYLLAIPMASNVGSTATITGNPQNMIIDSLSHIPYGTFAAALWPVAAVGLILTAVLIALVYRREFLTNERLPTVAARPARHNQSLIIKSVFVTIAMMVLFFAGQPVAKVAIVGGALLLFTRRVIPRWWPSTAMRETLSLPSNTLSDWRGLHPTIATSQILSRNFGAKSRSPKANMLTPYRTVPRTCISAPVSFLRCNTCRHTGAPTMSELGLGCVETGGGNGGAEPDGRPAAVKGVNARATLTRHQRSD
jgi:Citrate transporter